MKRFNEKKLASARPNGFDISLWKIWAVTEPEDDAYFVVYEDTTDGYDQDLEEFDLEVNAREYYENRRRVLLGTPNWEAQAQYDEMHGTINGEDAGIVAMRELWGE